MISKEIKDLIFIQIIDIYRKEQPNITEEDIKERIEVFSMLLSFASTCKEESLRMTENEFTQIFENIRNGRKINIKEISIMEPVLRLLYFVINEKDFVDCDMNIAMLAKLYRKLDVLKTKNNSKRANYYELLTLRDNNNKPYGYGHPKHPENTLKDDHEILPFVKAYCTRNSLIHWQNTPAEWERFMNAIYSLIEITYRYKSKIISTFLRKELSYKEYIDKFIKNYEEQHSVNFTYIPLNIDIFPNDLYDELKKRYSDIIQNITFEDINNDLNQNNIYINKSILYNKAKIIGYAGMGKTTIIEKIAYDEAVKIRENNYQGKLPVIIRMIEVDNADEDNSIYGLIAKQLGIKSMTVLMKILSSNMISLYIDGINEIRINDIIKKREYLEKLEEFVLKNRNIKIIVTDRDNNENSILNAYPTFVLLGISKENVKQFVLGNSSKPELVYEKIKTAIEKEPALLETIKNPFMIKNLISIVECNKPIPENPDDIAEQFLKSIVERERVIKRDYKAPHVLRLLIFLVAEDTKRKNGNIDGNLIMSYFELCNIFDKYCEKYKKNDRFDNDEMLDLIVKLGIMKKVDTEKYTFVDDTYYNFFYFSADDLGLLND